MQWMRDAEVETTAVVRRRFSLAADSPHLFQPREIARSLIGGRVLGSRHSDNPAMCFCRFAKVIQLLGQVQAAFSNTPGKQYFEWVPT